MHDAYVIACINASDKTSIENLCVFMFRKYFRALNEIPGFTDNV